MTRTVEDIRRDIDSLDDRIHDLLMERAELVVGIGKEKRRTGTQVVQPDREAVMIRRLLERHRGPLPREAVVRIWRELVGAVSLLQTGLKVAVAAPDDNSGLITWDMAKDYFSSVLPMHKAGNPSAALGMVRDGDATFAVVPWPENEAESPWWRLLFEDTGERPMRIMARLPFGDRNRNDANPEFRALVVARVRYEPSGQDRSFIALRIGQEASRARVVDRVKALDMPVRSAFTVAMKASQETMHLLEIDGYTATDDARLADLPRALDYPGGRCLCLGGYPVPPVYDDKVGKNAPAGQSSTESA